LRFHPWLFAHTPSPKAIAEARRTQTEAAADPVQSLVGRLDLDKYKATSKG